MLKIAVLVPTVVLAGVLYGQTQRSVPKPRIAPFFSLERETLGPAFFVECRNLTDQPISSASREWALSREAVRIDGITLTETGGRTGPGLSQPIPSGGIWRGIVELRPSRGGTSVAPAFDANARMPLTEPLAPGRHVIAVRCLNEWSDDFPFYWQRQKDGYD